MPEIITPPPTLTTTPASPAPVLPSATSADAHPGANWDQVADADQRGFLEGLSEAFKADAPDPAALPHRPTPPTPTPPARSTTPPPTTPRLTRPTTSTPPPAPSTPTSPTPPPDDVAELTQPIPEFKGAKAEQWKQVHEKARGYLQRAVAAEDALKNLRTAAAEPYQKQISTLQAERQKFESELNRVALERSPTFQAEINSKLQSVTGKVTTLLPLDKADGVVKLLSSPPSDQRTAQLEKVMEGLSPLKQRAFADAVVAYDGVVQERSDRIAASLANWEADQAKAAHERTVKLEEARGIFAREQAEMARAFAVEGNDEHNTRVTAALAEARKNFESDLPMPRLAQMTMRDALHPVLTELAYKLSDRVAELETELSRLRGAEPGVGPGGGDQNTPAGDVEADIGKYGSVGAAIAADLARQGIPLG